MTLAEIKAQLRNGPYTRPGGFPKYFITSNGAALSFKTVREEWRKIVSAHLRNDTCSRWHIYDCDIDWEDAATTWQDIARDTHARVTIAGQHCTIS